MQPPKPPTLGWNDAGGLEVIAKRQPAPTEEETQSAKGAGRLRLHGMTAVHGSAQAYNSTDLARVRAALARQDKRSITVSE